jgi:hypothetical protein
MISTIRWRVNEQRMVHPPADFASFDIVPLQDAKRAQVQSLPFEENAIRVCGVPL